MIIGTLGKRSVLPSASALVSHRPELLRDFSPPLSLTEINCVRMKPTQRKADPRGGAFWSEKHHLRTFIHPCLKLQS